MIIITELADKIEQILNEPYPIGGIVNPMDFKFIVAVEGFHLDKIADKKTGRNKLPVFVGSLGGEHDPTPGLGRSTYTSEITIYFPVRFKDKIYKLNEYLKQVFVGKTINFGTQSGSALCNISVGQYGEIIGADLESFEEWQEEIYGENVSIYKNEIDVMENYMSMKINIFMQQITNGVFGNIVDFTMSMTFPYEDAQNPQKTLSTGLVFADSGKNINVSPIGQQLVGVDDYTKNVPNIISGGSSVIVYPSSSTNALEFWQRFVRTLNLQKPFPNATITKHYFGFTGQTFVRELMIMSVVENVKPGMPISYTITFGDKK